jgi:hypothetical protein
MSHHSRASLVLDLVASLRLLFHKAQIYRHIIPIISPPQSGLLPQDALAISLAIESRMDAEKGKQASRIKSGKTHGVPWRPCPGFKPQVSLLVSGLVQSTLRHMLFSQISHLPSLALDLNHPSPRRRLHSRLSNASLAFRLSWSIDRDKIVVYSQGEITRSKSR